ncbi:helicase RepA family protein [Octadecabacter antarcticus]|uniref:helicase RepA family protein n=1 Tax=Octadecabacter antarcticus TaxID=1217908 RepID=UPI00018060FD|nr:helicase RepA family protein [Octadecabacter antarcticus]
MRGQVTVTVTVAQGGFDQSSLTICEVLTMASGRDWVGEWVADDLSDRTFNLENPPDELQLRITAVMQQHKIAPEEIEGN